MEEDVYLPLSGIQHFCFCKRQWALIHLEQQWSENLRTAEGRLEHRRAHNDSLREKRGDILIVAGMRVINRRLRLSGICDIVEFHRDPAGVALQGQEGLWLPFPIEHKHGSPKEGDADRIQLCAQAMALEEMLVCEVPQGALFYAETRRRELVGFTPELRERTWSVAEEMNSYFDRGYTPKVKPGKHCTACSLKELCLPKLCQKIDPNQYIRSHIWEEGFPCGNC